jgi:hypothetical protein
MAEKSHDEKIAEPYSCLARKMDENKRIEPGILAPTKATGEDVGSQR